MTTTQSPLQIGHRYPYSELPIGAEFIVREQGRFTNGQAFRKSDDANAFSIGPWPTDLVQFSGDPMCEFLGMTRDDDKLLRDEIARLRDELVKPLEPIDKRITLALLAVRKMIAAGKPLDEGEEETFGTLAAVRELLARTESLASDLAKQRRITNTLQANVDRLKTDLALAQAATPPVIAELDPPRLAGTDAEGQARHYLSLHLTADARRRAVGHWVPELLAIIDVLRSESGDVHKARDRAALDALASAKGTIDGAAVLARTPNGNALVSQKTIAEEIDNLGRIIRTNAEARARMGDVYFKSRAGASSNPPATHRCKVCGALWKLYPADALSVASWSLVSKHCGKCCDNAPMGDQIEELPKP